MNLAERARALKRELYVLWLCLGHSDTPWYAKLLLGLTLAYAASPIDLIPDFIPVLGYLDDVLLVPLGIYLSLKLIPADVVAEARSRARAIDESARKSTVRGLPLRWLGVVLIAFLWGAVVVAFFYGVFAAASVFRISA